jgi:hypothetical protein
MTAPEMPLAPVSDPNQPVQPSTGMVLPRVEQESNGVLDPTFWQGLDAQSQGAVAESLPQPPQNESEYQNQSEEAGGTGPDAPQITGLSSGTPTATSATITWTTSKPATSQVEWGTEEGNYPWGTPVLDDQATSHTVIVDGLTPETLYHYQVASRDADGNIASAHDEFTTAAPVVP